MFRDSGNERTLAGSYEASVCITSVVNARQIVKADCEDVYSTHNTVSENHRCECECITLETRCYSEQSTLTND